jgi:hypothetical protein
MDGYDGCILIHKNSGRLLLTDENGLYDHFIKYIFEKCEGNIFLALVNPEDSEDEPNNFELVENSTSLMPTQVPRKKTFHESVYDKSLIRILVDEGKQPFMDL